MHNCGCYHIENEWSFIMSRTKDFIDPYLPIPFCISGWDNGDRILYQYPKCHASFQFFGDLEKYCHNCGSITQPLKVCELE